MEIQLWYAKSDGGILGPILLHFWKIWKYAKLSNKIIIIIIIIILIIIIIINIIISLM